MAQQRQWSTLLHERAGANAQPRDRAASSNPGVVQRFIDISWIPSEVLVALGVGVLGIWGLAQLVAGCLRSGKSKAETVEFLEAEARKIKSSDATTKADATPESTGTPPENSGTALQDAVNTLLDRPGNDQAARSDDTSEKATESISTSSKESVDAALDQGTQKLLAAKGDETSGEGTSNATTTDTALQDAVEVSLEQNDQATVDESPALETESKPRKPPPRKTRAPRVNKRDKKRDKYLETQAHVEPSTSAEPGGFTVKEKDRKKAVTSTGAAPEDIDEIADWVSSDVMWRQFTMTKETVQQCLAVTLQTTAAELDSFKTKHSEPDYPTAAKALAQMSRLSKEAMKVPKDKGPAPAKNTLRDVEAYWSRTHGEKSVATSKSGGGMLLLKGLSYNIDGAATSAHISLPSAGDGTFSEGHLKIEGGRLLNQYFFLVSDFGDATKIANSPTVKTDNPGNWKNLPGEVWREVKETVKELAVGTLT